MSDKPAGPRKSDLSHLGVPEIARRFPLAGRSDETETVKPMTTAKGVHVTAKEILAKAEDALRAKRDKPKGRKARDETPDRGEARQETVEGERSADGGARSPANSGVASGEMKEKNNAKKHPDQRPGRGRKKVVQAAKASQRDRGPRQKNAKEKKLVRPVCAGNRSKTGDGVEKDGMGRSGETGGNRERPKPGEIGQPWKQEGISRSEWYRRRKESK